uniref:Solute carrier family 35 member D3 n=1 Tax=Athene cunicularia TaxID=194338 RepID=A0A663M8F1_ATHCN
SGQRCRGRCKPVEVGASLWKWAQPYCNPVRTGATLWGEVWWSYGVWVKPYRGGFNLLGRSVSSLGTSMRNPKSYRKCTDAYFLSICPNQTGALFLFRVQKPCLFLSVTLPTGAGDLTGDAMGYVTGVLAVLIHAAYLVLIQKTSVDSEYGPLTAQYAIAVSATPFLIICSFASMDSINVWSFPGWKDPAMVCIFIACVLISCAMNFTTLHCTYINSAVTTSFVGVVKSIATITVGMVAFNDVEPTKLFIAGVVVNTLGSVIYCVAKYIETRRQSNYEDLEKEAREEEGKRQAGDQALFAMESISQEKGAEEAAVEGSAMGDSQSREEEKVSTEKPAKGPTVQGKAAGTQEVNRSSLKDAYLGVWRLVRGANYIKKDYLIENEELPNP